MSALPCPALRTASLAFLLVFATTASPLLAGETGRIQRAKDWLRRHVASPAQLDRYGMEWPASNASENDRQRLVVVVHGYDSKPEDLAGLTREISRADHRCATFRYPNDHRLAKSSHLLSRELHELKQRSPQCKVAIVAHSMGGLVARECIENPNLDPGNVERLIMIATPNQGTQLARYAIGTDICEHFVSEDGGSPVRRIRAAVADGLSEATDDMTPGSLFLTRLNNRQRNAEVKYTLFLGTGGGMEKEDLQFVSRIVRKAKHLPGMDEYASRFADHVADLDELVAGQGDGAVAVKRGRLPGVSDTVILKFPHESVLGSATDRPRRELYDAVLQRLED